MSPVAAKETYKYFCMNLIKAVKSVDSAGHLHVPRWHPASGERSAFVRVNRKKIAAISAMSTATRRNVM
jgi:hypothetical protein